MVSGSGHRQDGEDWAKMVRGGIQGHVRSGIGQKEEVVGVSTSIWSQRQNGLSLRQAETPGRESQRTTIVAPGQGEIG